MSSKEAAGSDDEENGEEEVDDEEDYSTTLRDNEKAMNENDLLRIPSEGFEHEDAAMAVALQSMDTLIHVCPRCTPRKVMVGRESMRLHMQECHNKNIQEEHDAIDGRIK